MVLGRSVRLGRPSRLNDMVPSRLSPSDLRFGRAFRSAPCGCQFLRKPTFTAGAQLYAVTTTGPPLDPGVGAALFLTWTALLVVVGMVLFQRRDVA